MIWRLRRGNARHSLSKRCRGVRPRPPPNSVVRGRPVAFATGMKGSIGAHSSSVNAFASRRPARQYCRRVVSAQPIFVVPLKSRQSSETHWTGPLNRFHAQSRLSGQALSVGGLLQSLNRSTSGRSSAVAGETSMIVTTPLARFSAIEGALTSDRHGRPALLVGARPSIPLCLQRNKLGYETLRELLFSRLCTSSSCVDASRFARRT